MRKWTEMSDDERAEALNTGMMGHTSYDGVNFRCAELDGYDFRCADLRGVKITGADLRRVNFEDAALDGVDFSGCDLRDADLSGASMKGTDLRAARLHGAKILAEDLSGALIPYEYARIATDRQLADYELDNLAKHVFDWRMRIRLGEHDDDADMACQEALRRYSQVDLGDALKNLDDGVGEVLAVPYDAGMWRAGDLRHAACERFAEAVRDALLSTCLGESRET